MNTNFEWDLLPIFSVSIRAVQKFCFCSVFFVVSVNFLAPYVVSLFRNSKKSFLDGPGFNCRFFLDKNEQRKGTEFVVSSHNKKNYEIFTFLLICYENFSLYPERLQFSTIKDSRVEVKKLL